MPLLLVFGGLLVWLVWSVRRFVRPRVAVAARCAQCGYEVALGGVCPECGGRYEETGVVPARAAQRRTEPFIAAWLALLLIVIGFVAYVLLGTMWPWYVVHLREYSTYTGMVDGVRPKRTIELDHTWHGVRERPPHDGQVKVAVRGPGGQRAELVVDPLTMRVVSADEGTGISAGGSWRAGDVRALYRSAGITIEGVKELEAEADRVYATMSAGIEGMHAAGTGTVPIGVLISGFARQGRGSNGGSAGPVIPFGNVTFPLRVVLGVGLAAVYVPLVVWTIRAQRRAFAAGGTSARDGAISGSMMLERANLNRATDVE